MKFYLLPIVFTAVTAINCNKGLIAVSITPGLTVINTQQKLEIVITASSCKSNTGQFIDGFKLNVTAKGDGGCFPTLGVSSTTHNFTITTSNSMSNGSGNLESTAIAFNLIGSITSGSLAGSELSIVGKPTLDMQSAITACISTSANNLSYQVESLSIKP